MNSIPPLSVTVSGRRRACVLDAELALHELGLLLASRICNEFDLWLVREFWEILDSTEAYLKHPEWLRPSLGSSEESRGKAEPKTNLASIFEQWETWRLESDLAGLKFYWIGDAMRESLLPKGIDHNVLHRYQVLARSLDAKIARLKPPQIGSAQENEAYKAKGVTVPSNLIEEKKEHRLHGARGCTNVVLLDRAENRHYDTLTECFRDAAALAAALAHYQGFILTHAGKQSSSGNVDPKPAICSYLERWNVECKPAAEGKTSIEMRHLVPILARTGVCELLWTGLKLSVVHLVLPKATIIPPARHDEDIYHEEFPMTEGEDLDGTDWWSSARCFYYSLRFE